jgi:uncharacterized protein YqhQ
MAEPKRTSAKPADATPSEELAPTPAEAAAEPRQHFYGGQAVLEGVMMRGKDHWAIAVRRPDKTIHLEHHEIDSIAKRKPVFAKPGLRGVIALGQAMSIGVRALTISANQAVEEEEQLTRKQMIVSMTLAMVFFLAVFMVGPALAVGTLFERWVGSGVASNLIEGLIRVLLFLGYLAAIGQMKDIRRVFMYHGAEHKTIAAYEHDEELVPANVDKYSTLHVRCGTNFLLIVMILTILVYSLVPTPGLFWRITSRIIGIPVIAGLAYEMLRLGAKYERSKIMRALMTPGLWLQKITTKPPTEDQIEIAIASFNEVLKAEGKLPAA